MPTAFDRLEYAIPGSNGISLDKKLADQIRKHFNTDRENRFQLFLLAAGIRNKYLNKKTGHYSGDFDDWFRKNKMEDVYGGVKNFIKYASAGDVVAHTAFNTSDPEKYLQQLPISLRALYEISFILKGSIEKKNNWFLLCLNHRQFIKLENGKEVPTRDKSTIPLINKHVTAPEIKAWLENRNNPVETLKQKRKDDRVLLLATISVSGSLYDFNKKTGDHIGSAKLQEVQRLMKELTRLFSKTEKIIKIDSNLPELETKYQKRVTQYDPAYKILKKKKPMNRAVK